MCHTIKLEISALHSNSKRHELSSRQPPSFLSSGIPKELCACPPLLLRAHNSDVLLSGLHWCVLDSAFSLRRHSTRWRGVLREGVSGRGGKNDSKTNCGSKLTTCVICLTQLFQSESLCVLLSLSEDFSVYILLACYSKRSLCPCPASLCVSVCVCVCVSVCLSVSVLQEVLSFYPKKFSG